MDDIIPDILIRDCKPYLTELKSSFSSGVRKVLRRGMVFQAENDITKIKVNKNRKPTNTLPSLHEACDKWFEDKFNIKARSSSVFCTSVKADAKKYGISYMVFPIGQYQTIYSTEVHDLFHYLVPSKIASMLGASFENENPSNIYSKSTNIIKSASMDDLYPIIDQILSDASYKINNLPEALASKNEIMVVCDNYYIIADTNDTVMEFLFDYLMG